MMTTLTRQERSNLLWIACLALVLALGFLGSRGIWDPDEGRYTNVAVNMLESGDWLNPRRNDEVGHWTKPPLTYWAIATSVGAFGMNPWAARLPVALAYLACVLLVWRIGRRLMPDAAAAAALVYATMLLPWAASQLVTTDYLLTACETLAMWAFVEARSGSAHPRRWIALVWAGLALAFLTKGPPGLLPLLVMVVFDRLSPGRHRVFDAVGIGLFALLALPWFVAVVLNTPGLFEYLVGDEVVNRITTDQFGRNGQWYGWLVVYGPTLLIGTLPWTRYVWRWARGLPGAVAEWRRERGDRRLPDLLLGVWIVLPLLVLCLSRSRLPLYVLPLMVPIALAVAAQRTREGRPRLPGWPAVALWAAALLALRLASAYWPTHKNAAEWADAIRARVAAPVSEVVFVEDMARYGLRLHLDAEVEKIALDPIAPGTEPRFNPPHDEDLATELREVSDEPGAVWVCKEAMWQRVRDAIGARGFVAEPLDPPFRGRVIFRVRSPVPAPPLPPARAKAMDAASQP